MNSDCTVLLTTRHQLWTIQTATEKTFLLQSLLTTLHCDCLLMCTLKILSLSYSPSTHINSAWPSLHG